jgi:TRAP-type C4-dicarboxylate transport system substrate-binding protein
VEDKMKFRPVVTTFGAAILGVAVAGALSSAAVAADPAVVKMGSFTPPKAGYLNDITIPWMRQVEKDSAGTLKFQEFWGGALIRSPRKQWEGLVNGIQDATTVLPDYTAKLFPDYGILALPFLFHDVGSKEASIVGWKMHERGMLGGTEKAHVVAVYTNDNSGLHFAKTVKSLDDIKGLKVRVPGPEQADVLKEFGLVPVGMGAPQIAESLNRGVIQGTLMGWSAINTFRITPLTKSHVNLPLGVRSFFVALRKDVYDGLPAKARAAIDKNSGLAFSLKYGEYYEKEGLRMRTHTAGRNVVTVSEAEEKELAKKFKPFHDAWIKNTPDGAKKYKVLQEILASVRGNT